jgi:photosystem II stability/assembly factor-like uncharacterized protein
LAAVGLLTLALTGPAQGQDDRLARATAHLEWREIGPAIMGGRITDLALVESNPAIFFVGTATGGLWRTLNHGTTWEPLFDDQPTSSIGDVTIAQSNPNLVWVGTGEPQNRQSSPWGNGVYKSTDAGRTWEHMGLTETMHISRIAIHPMNHDIVYVAAVGHLWGPNPERGVYQTVDGGKTWKLSLFVDEHTGAIDLAMDPGDPETLFAAMYQRRRTGFGFNGGGPGSGIYRTTDGGNAWTELTNGLPEGDKGRIGLDIYRQDGNMVFAIVEADLRGSFAPFGAQQEESARDRVNGVYRSTDRGETWEHLSTTNNRPMYYSQIRVDPNDPERIYLGGARLYVSKDGGKTFTDDAASDVHSDHHALWIDPANSNHMILGGDGGVSVSWDRSHTWRQLRNLPLAQFYEIGVDMRDPYYVCGGLQDNGSWCGPSATLSNQGVRNRDWYNVNGGDGFYTLIDPNDPTIMFAESQGGNLARVDLNTMERVRMRPVPRPGNDVEEREYRFNWDAPLVMSSHNPMVIYFGANHVLKSTDRGMSWREMSPDLTKQIDRSELEIMGVKEDKMLSRHDGISSYGNITTVSESPINADVVYAGTDDGNVHITRDGGENWTDLTLKFKDVPDRTYVSRVVSSRFAEGRVYVTFDGHRNDDYRPYVYVSEDYGERWRSLTRGLADGWTVNVIAEHPRTSNLLFLGNEIGVYFSIDRGENWVQLKSNLPTVPVDDIVVHPRDNDLVVGTHGRSIWILPDVAPLEELSNEVMASATHLFRVRKATTYNQHTPQGWTPGVYEAPDPPLGALIRYYLRDDMAAPEDVVAEGSNGGDPALRRRDSRNGNATARITILDQTGATIRELEGPGMAGVQHVMWDLRFEPPYVAEEGEQRAFRGPPRGPKVLPGTYTVRLDAADQTLRTELVVRGDPRVEISPADLEARQQALMSAYRLAKPNYEAGRAVRRLRQQLGEVQALLKESGDAPEALKTEVDSLQSHVQDLAERLNDAGSNARAGFAIEGSTSRPTDDQLWQLDQAWERIPALIAELNVIISDQMPALYRQLDEHGIRPSPGEPIVVPRR